jgi:hypothetical protein
VQNHQFESALRVFNVPGYDIVLGCDRLSGMRDIKLNLLKGMLTMKTEVQLITLHIDKVPIEMQYSDERIDLEKEEKKGIKFF